MQERFRQAIRQLRENRVEEQRKIGSRGNCHRTTIARHESGKLEIHRDDAVMYFRVYGEPKLLDIYCAGCVVHQARQQFRKLQRPGRRGEEIEKTAKKAVN